MKYFKITSREKLQSNKNLLIENKAIEIIQTYKTKNATEILKKYSRAKKNYLRIFQINFKAEKHRQFSKIVLE